MVAVTFIIIYYVAYVSFGFVVSLPIDESSTLLNMRGLGGVTHRGPLVRQRDVHQGVAPIRQRLYHLDDLAGTASHRNLTPITPEPPPTRAR
jgi:hypothetical protein